MGPLQEVSGPMEKEVGSEGSGLRRKWAQKEVGSEGSRLTNDNTDEEWTVCHRGRRKERVTRSPLFWGAAPKKGGSGYPYRLSFVPKQA